MAGEKVMVVDDSATDSQILCSTLSAAGYSTLAVGSADDALTIAREEQPSAILMDVVMPGTNGFQATRQLHNDPQTSKIPIIIISSKNKASDKVWGLRQGAVAYLTKPVSKSELIEKIRDLT